VRKYLRQLAAAHPLSMHREQTWPQAVLINPHIYEKQNCLFLFNYYALCLIVWMILKAYLLFKQLFKRVPCPEV